MAEYTLYCFAQSGNCYKPALMLELCGADWTPHVVDYFHGETRTPDWRAEVNEMGEAPVLVHGGRKLSQSGVILDYLAATLGRFGAHDEAGRREILRWLLWDNHKLTSYTATYRFMRAFTDAPNAEVMAEFRKRSEGAWKVLDAHLATHEYVAAPRLTIADLSCCGYLFFDEEIGVDWNATHPHIARWLATIRREPGWRHPYDMMPGHPLLR
jgi:glutathione S-transferase